jgi:hypothetical protein
MIPLLSNVAVQDQTVVSNIVTLDNIMSGVDGSATFGYNIESLSLEVNDKQKQQYAQTHTFDIRVVKSTSASQAVISAISDNNRLVKVSGHSPDGFFLWDEPTLMAQSPNFNEIVSQSLLLTHDTTIGYRGTAPLKKLGVYAGDNALALYDVLSGSASVLNGFSLLNNATGSVTGSAQTVTVGATTVGGTVYLRSANIFFPFAGIPLSGSIGITTQTGDYELGIEFVQSNGTAIISTSTNTFDAGSAPQRATVIGTTPVNTVYIRLVIRASQLNAADAVTFNSPMLALAGRTAFTL